MRLEIRPITLWPGPMTTHRKRAPFKAGYEDTLRLLDFELQKLGASAVVLQMAYGEDEIRLDGRPRANAAPRHPGVILAFDSRHGSLSYPCDRFLNWRDNLRAIALGLEHLRTLDRYGIVRRGEQYRGWQQLAYLEPAMTREQAAAFLAQHSGYAGRPDELLRQPAALLAGAYRAAAKQLHPDRGGDERLFKRLQEARRVLGLAE